MADCGAGYASSALLCWYYNCARSNCVNATLAVAQQVTNPVANFPADNNGVLIELPALPASGASAVTGTMTFGIGSQSNNLLGSATVLKSNSSTGYVSTTMNGSAYSSSFLDSGSNGLFFPPATLTVCGAWYCPSSTQSFTATITSTTGTSVDVGFSIGQSTALFAIGNYAFNNLAGSVSGYFDWGLPFFFGCRVFRGARRTRAADGRRTVLRVLTRLEWKKPSRRRDGFHACMTSSAYWPAALLSSSNIFCAR